MKYFFSEMGDVVTVRHWHYKLSQRCKYIASHILHCPTDIHQAFWLHETRTPGTTIWQFWLLKLLCPQMASQRCRPSQALSKCCILRLFWLVTMRLLSLHKTQATGTASRHFRLISLVLSCLIRRPLELPRSRYDGLLSLISAERSTYIIYFMA